MVKAESKLKKFFVKYNFALTVCLCLVLACLNLFVSKYFMYAYLIVILIAAMFYDVNKVTVLCLISIFGFQFLHVWGLSQFTIGYTVICLRKILINKQKLDKTFIFPVAVFVCMTLLFVFVNFQLKNWKTIAQVLLPLFISIEVYFLRNDFKLDKVIKHSVYLLFFICTISVVMLLTKLESNKILYHDAVGVNRFRGLTGHENSLAIFSILYMAFCLLLFFKKKVSIIEFYLVELILSMLGLSTKSKMFLILFLLLLICYFVKQFRKNGKNELLELSIFMMFAGIIGMVFHNKLAEILGRFTGYFNDSSFFDMITTGRVEIWKHYLNLWIATPVTIFFGIGGSYQDSYINYSHNQYVEILCKFGIVGFALVFAFAIYFIVITKKRFKYGLENFIPICFIVLIAMMELLNSSIAGIILIIFCVSSFNYVGNSPKPKCDNVIPKIIHYIWFGEEKIPDKAQELIKSWQEKLPDYKFMFWNEDVFKIDSAPEYVKQAYKSKKFAFVSDYVRLYALYKYGGIYLDTDVEVVKKFDDLLNNSFFIGREDAVYLSTSVIGAVKENEIVAALLRGYEDRKFVNTDGAPILVTNVETISQYLKCMYDYDFVNTDQFFDDCSIYKREKFSPKNYMTRKIIKSKNTYSIHYFDASWEDTYKSKFKRAIVFIMRTLPANCSNALVDEYKKIQFLLKNIKE